MSYKMLLKDSLLYIPAKVLPAITTIFFISFLFRNLASSDYVAYSVIITTGLIAMQLSSGWIANSILYYFPQKQDKSVFLSDAMAVMACAGVVGTTLATLVIALHHAMGVLACFMVLLIGQILFYTLASVFQSSRQIAVQLMATLIQCGTQVGLIVIFFLIGKINLASAIFSFGAGFLLAALYYCFKLGQAYALNTATLATSLRNLRSANVAEIVRYGLPLTGWLCATLLLNSVDRFFLKGSGLEVAAASYISAKDLLIGASGLITMPLLMASHPLIFKLMLDQKKEQAEKIVQNNIKILTLMFTVYFTALQFSGAFFLKLFFGAKYAIDMHVLLIVLLGVFFSCVSMYTQKGLEVARRTALMASLAAIAAIGALISSWLLIPHFGLLGAALAFSSSSFCYLVLVTVAATPSLKVWLHPADLLLPAAVWLLGAVLRSLMERWHGLLAPFYLLDMVWLLTFLVVVGAAVFGFLRFKKQRDTSRNEK